jgi:diacylglycerol kinase (ATP)
MQRIVAAYFNSLRALKRAWGSESAVRQELVLLALAVPLAVLIAPGAWVRVALVGAILLVLMIELLNTAIEKICDRLHQRPGLGRCADVPAPGGVRLADGTLAMGRCMDMN